MQSSLGNSMLQPIMVATAQSFGTLLNLQIHQHWVVSDGAFAPDVSFHPLPRIQKKVRDSLTKLLQRCVLDWLVRIGKLSPQERDSMLRWK